MVSTNGSTVMTKPSLMNFSLSTRDSIHLSTVKAGEKDMVKVDFSLVIRNSVTEGSMELETCKENCKDGKEQGTAERIELGRDDGCKGDIELNESVSSCRAQTLESINKDNEGNMEKEMFDIESNEGEKSGSESACNFDCETDILM